jgi:hypothetical protein
MKSNLPKCGCGAKIYDDAPVCFECKEEALRKCGCNGRTCEDSGHGDRVPTTSGVILVCNGGSVGYGTVLRHGRLRRSNEL